jgi:hypothetical protein
MWPTGMPKCPVSPEDRGECVEPPTGLVQCPKCLWWSNQIELHLCPKPSPDVRTATIEECAAEIERLNWPCVGDARRIASSIRALLVSRPEDRGEDVEPSSTQDAASQTPMVADIAQIILSGHANGKTRFEIAEDIVREFSLSRPHRGGIE